MLLPQDAASGRGRVGKKKHRPNIGHIGDRNRINVALTRAREALYILGNMKTLAVNDIWKKLKEDALRRKCLYDCSELGRGENQFFPIRRLKSVVVTSWTICIISCAPSCWKNRPPPLCMSSIQDLRISGQNSGLSSFFDPLSVI